MNLLEHYVKEERNDTVVLAALEQFGLIKKWRKVCKVAEKRDGCGTLLWINNLDGNPYIFREFAGCDLPEDNGYLMWVVQKAISRQPCFPQLMGAIFHALGIPPNAKILKAFTGAHYTTGTNN